MVFIVGVGKSRICVLGVYVCMCVYVCCAVCV